MSPASRYTILTALWSLTAAGALAGCTTKNPGFCESNEDCTASSAPFCDVDGAFGDRNSCTAFPPIDAGLPPDATQRSDAHADVDASESDTPDAGIGAAFPVVSAGADHTCARLEDGRAVCWGTGLFGRLGYGDILDVGDDETPAAAGAIDVGGSVIDIAAGGRHTCAVLSSQRVRCWGDGFEGALGYGNQMPVGDDETPASVGDVNVGGPVTKIAAGDSHTCALLMSGDVRCWGRGNAGRLGYGNTNPIGDNEAPALAGTVNVGGTVVQVVAGGSHTCALLEGGAVKCWGDGSVLGYGSTSPIGDDETPAAVGPVSLGGTAVEISAGLEHTCARMSNGDVRCWGKGLGGRLGTGNDNDIGDDELPSSIPAIDLGGRAIDIATGHLHSCAVLESGAVRCWGAGANGALGYANTEDVGDDESPASAGDVVVGGPAVRVTAGDTRTCATLSSGAVRCWGNGADGRLGYGNLNDIGDNETPASAGDVMLPF